MITLNSCSKRIKSLPVFQTSKGHSGDMQWRLVSHAAQAWPKVCDLHIFEQKNLCSSGNFAWILQNFPRHINMFFCLCIAQKILYLWPLPNAAVLLPPMTGKTWTMFFLLSMFESWHGPYSALKRRLFCQTWWNTAITYTPKNQKMAALQIQCRKGKTTFLKFLCLSCSSGLVEFFHHPIANLCAKIGALNPSNNRKRCLEIMCAAAVSSNYASKGFFAHGDFSFLNRLWRIFVHTITRGKALSDWSWALVCKNTHILQLIPAHFLVESNTQAQ